MKQFISLFGLHIVISYYWKWDLDYCYMYGFWISFVTSHLTIWMRITRTDLRALRLMLSRGHALAMLSWGHMDQMLMDDMVFPRMTLTTINISPLGDLLVLWLDQVRHQGASVVSSSVDIRWRKRRRRSPTCTDCGESRTHVWAMKALL